MKDPVARGLSLAALAVGLTALIVAVSAARTSDLRQQEMRALGVRIERALAGVRTTPVGPPPTFDDTDR
jgi:hypothetical protein